MVVENNVLEILKIRRKKLLTNLELIHNLLADYDFNWITTSDPLEEAKIVRRIEALRQKESYYLDELMKISAEIAKLENS
jgi:hypothetical protein